MMQPISRKRSRVVLESSEQPTVKVAKIRSSLPIRMLGKDENNTSPQEYLMEIVKNRGIDVQIHDSLQIQGFFSEYTEEEVSSYNADVLNAIRNQDIAKLREFHESGRPLKCSNSFGESLIHMACRRGFYDVVSFLIREAKVPVRVRDDYGRTILHDAAWTCEPNFELLELILTECPDLLYMRDRRGDTPISYARKSHWHAWKKFLKQNADLVIPVCNVNSLQ
jgi:ankyrin repeat protein